MAQLAFLVLAIVGLVNTVDFVYGSSQDEHSIRYGRIGLAAFAIGVLGLLAIAFGVC